MLHGDFGFSIATGGRWPPSSASGCRRPCILAGIAYLIWIILAFLLAVYAAVQRYSIFDTIFTVFNYVGYRLAHVHGWGYC